MPKTVHKLKEWRTRRGFTLEQAGCCVVVDGKAASRGTWHAWETGKKLPQKPQMFELERLTGAEPNDFYTRPDAGDRITDAEILERLAALEVDPAQPSLM